MQGYNIRIGTEKPLKDDDFIITPSVSKNLALLARIVCSGRFPVLLEGETSTGKTSMVTLEIFLYFIIIYFFESYFTF